jgi:hypothetical protein
LTPAQRRAALPAALAALGCPLLTGDQAIPQERVRDDTKNKQRELHISLGVNFGPQQEALLFFFTYNLNLKLNSQNIFVYEYGNWERQGLSGPTRNFEPAFESATTIAKRIHFNLEGIRGDPVVFAEKYGSGRFIDGYFVAWELYQIRRRPDLCRKTDFYTHGSTDVSMPSIAAKAAICSVPWKMWK